MSLLRVCVVSPGELPVPATRGGAIETLIMSLVTCNEKKHQLDLTVTSVADSEAQQQAARYRNTRFLFIKQSARIPDTIYHYWQAVWKRVFPKSHIMSSLYYRKVLKAIRGNHYDAVIFEGGESYGFAAYNRVFHGKLWYHVHATPVRRTPSATFNDVLAISEYVAQQWSKWCTDHNQHLHVLHNGINTAAFKQTLTIGERAQLRAQYGFSDNDFVVMYCGRLFSGKGVKELVEAVVSIKDPNIKLLVVGYAHDTDAKRYEQEIKDIAQSAGDRICFTGYVPNADVWRYYNASDVQVIPSLWEEGAGNICIEGMAAGLPIIATRSGGMPEYLAPECSILVDKGPQLVHDLAVAITVLQKDPQRCEAMSAFARKHAELFSEDAYYTAYVRLLNTFIQH
ncbi:MULTISPECIES: glycosyltransferase family 4 protein [unclassified Bifidobacterium]|uniref:glycosyltransferase family 4 protein n=1 Tax=unclassified Bifidobacterium TaxID=2608897 RepID=UPI00112EFA24|nr:MULTISPECIES: glycosyltransferase family 4 protein [unclassified Bifidobacterium]TPF78573.1 hypothetical protein BW09_03630 [Bifidobacterium sp. UTCIF-1]TPF80854.1 hypothetical protein BW08_02595 [Bifidobacterium sp. UTCIF-24]TPF82707.1 hypothetical protein BW12_03035 [Bifidobacterium sp. UTCIF-3]TPF84519.1 hypothetical protein BW07_04520 [Bifidobacterium sp. UTCIF-36]TPF90920.1 hypothetical protein BW10_01510 [Bifidobacterium sp. UTBIF-56]